ncbi:MAG TPA: DUF2807 domain-containing protein [Hyphomonadaceae bacterium]|jgi:hypothetical protein|nr:DUF2807 domain-containing protein [Hyphomonadaceae bacterium]
MKPIRLLAFTALGSALLSAGCIGGAYTLASANDSGSSELITREIPWDGSATLIPELPSITRYIQAPGPGKIIARGPHRSVSTLTVANGHIHDKLLHTGAVIELTVTAPNVTAFAVNGRSTLTIENFDQDSLTVTVQGTAQITASGRTQTASVDMQGDGIANLARLKADSLTATATGLGIVIGAPTASANLALDGAAAAILLTRPPQLTTDIKEYGQLIDASPS